MNLKYIDIEIVEFIFHDLGQSNSCAPDFAFQFWPLNFARSKKQTSFTETAISNKQLFADVARMLYYVLLHSVIKHFKDINSD